MQLYLEMSDSHCIFSLAVASKLDNFYISLSLKMMGGNRMMVYECETWKQEQPV